MAGFDVDVFEMDLSSRQSIREMIAFAHNFGKIIYLINGAAVSYSQASIKTILDVDLYGTAILLEEVGKVISNKGVGLVITSQSGHRMESLSQEQDKQLTTIPTEELLALDFLQVDQVQDSLRAYQLSKRANEKRIMAEAVKWGRKRARLNAIAPEIVVTPLAIDEFNGPRGEFYQKMFSESPAGRPATADEIASVADLLMNERSAFITGSTFLIDGGATAMHFYSENN